MKLSVFGLGYVGCVSAACFAKEGHEMVGVDPNATKVGIINEGKSPIVEAGIDELIGEVVAAGRLRATTDAADAVNNSEISLICVGTPSHSNGSLDLTYVKRVCKEIGAALETKELTTPSLYAAQCCRARLRARSFRRSKSIPAKKAGRDFGVCINPEFLREGTSLKDFYAPPFTLIGADEEETHARAPLVHERGRTALCRAGQGRRNGQVCVQLFPRAQVSFANEIGNICKGLDIDSHQVMNVFCQDTKLISRLTI
jgi:GDP-mannose 6-dehydrogenase